MADESPPQPHHEGALEHLGHRVVEGVEHLAEGVRRRIRAAELASEEAAPSSILAAAEGAEALVDPDREAERAAEGE